LVMHGSPVENGILRRLSVCHAKLDGRRHAQYSRSDTRRRGLGSWLLGPLATGNPWGRLLLSRNRSVGRRRSRRQRVAGRRLRNEWPNIRRHRSADRKGRTIARSKHHRRTADYRGTIPGGASARPRGHRNRNEPGDSTAGREQKGQRFLAHRRSPPYHRHGPGMGRAGRSSLNSDRDRLRRSGRYKASCFGQACASLCGTGLSDWLSLLRSLIKPSRWAAPLSSRRAEP
jgi:hypothetical protein